MAGKHRRTAGMLAIVGRVAPVVAIAGAVALSAADQNQRDWRDYGGGPDNSQFTTPEADRQVERRRSSRSRGPIRTARPLFNPIVVRGVVYGKGRNSSLVALDAATGKEIWIHDGLDGMTRRGVNYWESKDGKDRRLIFSISDYLQEIDAATGKSIRHVRHDGVVDLREGLGRDPATIGRIQSNTPGKIFENLLILGSATGEAYFSPPGDLRAYDVVTGKLVWQFHTVPHPGEFGYETWPKDAWKYIGGTNTWGEITVDAGRGIAYFPDRIGHLRLLRRRSASAPTSSPTACSRSTRARASGCGISRTCTTISGTTTTRRRRS